MNTKMAIGTVTLLAATIGGVGTAGTAAAAPVALDATIHEVLPIDGTPGTLVAGSIPGCASPSVTNTAGSASTYGALTVFRGEKLFDCGGGDTFTLRFRAAVYGCATNDLGAWRITGGTGDFAGASGGGVLVGSYTLDGGAGTACANDGIDDRYRGVIDV